MKRLIATTMLLIAAETCLAESCNIDVHASFRVTPGEIEIKAQEKPIYKIVRDRDLYLNGKAQSLSPRQQELVAQYANTLRAMVPQVHQLGLDSVDLASDAVAAVFTELLGQQSPTLEQVKEQFNLIKADMEKNYRSGELFYFDDEHKESSSLSASLDQRLNTLMEAAGKEVTWAMIKQVGISMLSAEDTTAFENRMEQFGEKMGKAMEVRGQKLGVNAEQLCNNMILANAQEDQISSSAKFLNTFNFFDISTRRNDIAQDEHGGNDYHQHHNGFHGM